MIEAFDKLGIPLQEQERIAGVAVDAVFDSASVATTYKETLAKHGVIFCSFTEAIQSHPELIKKYLGSVVPYSDNFYAALNAAVFSDGSFAYIPKGVRCPLELMTYFRINQANAGQFERTLIVADDGAYVSYLEGCTAPIRKENQLHAAVVELVALDNAEIKYSTLQNWYPGRPGRHRRRLQLRNQAGQGAGRQLQGLLDPGGDGLRHHLEVPQRHPARGQLGWRVLLRGPGEQLPAGRNTGTKMTHIGKNSRSTIVSKGISAGHGNNTYRGLVKVLPSAAGAKNYTQCDSLLAGRHLRGAYGALHRGPQPDGPGRARGLHLQGERRPALLLHAAGHFQRRRPPYDHQRLLQGGSFRSCPSSSP